MKLEYVRLRLGPFKSFVTEQTLDFHALGPGLFKVEGDNQKEPRLAQNGAGKSSLWDALSWVQYGRTLGGQFTPDVVPWSGGKADVTLTIRVDGKKHKINRRSVTNGLSLDGEPVGQEQVEKLLGMSYPVFCQTVAFGQHRPLFFDLSPAEKLDLLANTLDLSRWDRRSEAAGARAKKLNEAAIEIGGEISGLKSGIERMADVLADLEKQRDEWETTRQKQKDAADEAVQAAQKRFDVLDKRYGKSDLSYDGAETELRALERELASLREKHTVANSKLQAAYAQERIYLENITDAERQYDDVSKQDQCEYCGQEIDDRHRKRLRKAMDKHVAELNRKKSKLYIGEREDDFNAIEQKLKRCRKDFAAFHDAAVKAQDEYEANHKAMIEARAELRAAKDSRKALNDAVNPFVDQHSALRKKIGKQKSELKNAQDELADVEARAERYKFWVKGFRDVRLHLLTEFLDDLEAETNALFDELGLVEWACRYQIERETKTKTAKRGIHVELFKPNDDTPRRFEAFSGGEQQRLRLASGLALSETLLRHAGVTPDLEILDEPNKHLSSSGTRDLCDYLSERAARLNRGIFLTDHTRIASAAFTGAIMVTKGKGGSRIGP